MSVEYCVVRVTPQLFERLQGQPSFLQDLMDEFYAPSSSDENEGNGFIDSRDVIRSSHVTTPRILRMLYVDEFTTSLLVNFMEENSAFFIALAGWGKAHILEGVTYGYGDISYYSPDEVTSVALELNSYPDALLEARFREQAEDFRIASAGYFKNDQAILTHQLRSAEFLRRFYNEAAKDGDFVLLLTV